MATTFPRWHMILIRFMRPPIPSLRVITECTLTQMIVREKDSCVPLNTGGSFTQFT